MSSHTTHTLVDSYLRELELLLQGVEPGERAEVLAGVREHLDGSLAPGADDASVRAVLAELGPPQAIADEAYAGRPAPSPPRATRSQWQAVTATILNAVGLLLAGLLALAGPHPSEVAFVGLIFTVPWLIGVTLAAMSPVWQTRDKVASSLFFPGLLGALAVVTAIVRPAMGPGTPVRAALMVALVLAAGWPLVLLLRKAAWR